MNVMKTFSVRYFAGNPEKIITCILIDVQPENIIICWDD